MLILGLSTELFLLLDTKLCAQNPDFQSPGWGSGNVFNQRQKKSQGVPPPSIPEAASAEPSMTCVPPPQSSLIHFRASSAWLCNILCWAWGAVWGLEVEGLLGGAGSLSMLLQDHMDPG